MNQPRILFATVAAGGAHVSTAKAMAEAINTYYPGEFSCDVREIMRDYGFAEDDERHKDFWRWALEKPWRARLGQRVLDTYPWTTNFVHRVMLRKFAKVAAAHLKQDPPALVVVNHPWLCVALTMSQRRYGLHVPVLTFQTSTFDTSALWAEADCERIVLGGSRARDKLVAMGVPESKIDVVGYPLRQAVLNPKSKPDARAALGLPERFTCLLVLGGEGVGGNPEGVIAALEGLELPLAIVVICGRNNALKEKLAARDAAHLHAVGYTEQMADYLAASDVVIGKTGATAVFEALAVGRPVLAPQRSGGIETLMIDILAQHQLGGSAPLPHGLQAQVRAYYDEPERLRAVYERTRAIDFAGLTRRLTDYLVHYARTGAPATRLRGSGLAL